MLKMNYGAPDALNSRCVKLAFYYLVLKISFEAIYSCKYFVPLQFNKGQC